VALTGLPKASHTTNSKNFPIISKHLINDHVEMSEKPPPKKARVARGKSDGKYLGGHGPTNKFQAQWLEHQAPERQPQRKDWLSDGGVDEKNWYQVHCSICPAIFSARSRTLRAMRSATATRIKQQHG
jgi:hypothetical protein